MTCARAGSRLVTMLMSSPRTRDSISALLRTMSVRFSTRGSTIVLRLNTMSCRVRSAARSPALWISSMSPRTGLSAGSFISTSWL